MVASGDTETIEGVLERFIFVNEDGTYAVARLQPDRGDSLAAVGVLAGLHEGERVRLVGRRENSPRFGLQFRALFGTPVLPHTAGGIRSYLAGGRVPGIGAGLAERLVQRFGAETLQVIEHEPDRLAEVEGIGPVRSQRIREAFRESSAQRDALVFLQGHAVTPGQASRIWRRYQGQTIALIRENPYRLAEEISGIGFATADRIARALGFAPDSPHRATAALVHLLAAASDDGHVFLPRPELLERARKLLGEVSPEPELDRLVAEERLVEEAPSVYLRWQYAAETEAATRLAALLAAPPVTGAVVPVEIAAGLTLAPAQQEAVQRAAEAPVLVITGGPGTGKTTIVRALVLAVEAGGGKLLLAAPTGRAARRLAEATERPARTLHRLLEYSPQEDRFLRDPDRPFEATCVVVDEASMIDQQLFVALLRALAPGTRLVLVGDADQLPSVGAGNVLGDLLASGVVPAVRLTEIFRQARESRIVTNAHRIRAGEAPLADPEAADFFIVRAADGEDALDLVVRLVETRIPGRFGLRPDEIQVLAPMHRGACGTQRLNEVLQARLNPPAEGEEPAARLRVGDKVMQVRNDYEKEVFNGDVGRVVARTETGLRIAFPQQEVDYAGADLDAVVLAYACSVHKSQGSEYPAVVVPVLTEHWVMLQRNLLYTAVTRGKKLVVLVGQAKAIDRAVRNDQGLARYTALAARLRMAVA